MKQTQEPQDTHALACPPASLRVLFLSLYLGSMSGSNHLVSELQDGFVQ